MLSAAVSVKSALKSNLIHYVSHLTKASDYACVMEDIKDEGSVRDTASEMEDVREIFTTSHFDIALRGGGGGRGAKVSRVSENL